VLHPFVVRGMEGTGTPPVQQTVHTEQVVVDGRNSLSERDANRCNRLPVNMHLCRLAIEVAGLGLPMLAFAFVGRQFDGMTVPQMVCLVYVQ